MSIDQRPQENAGDQVGRWISFLERLVRLLRPKIYNVLAKLVIGAGLALVIQSNTNIFTLFLIAIFEKYFGPSDFLRDQVAQTSAPYLGVSMVVVGLAYHYLMTIGKEQIDLALAKLPAIPSLSFHISDADGQEYVSQVIEMRGAIITVPADDEISDYYSPPNPLTAFSRSVLRSPFTEEADNSDFYRERANLLRRWGGAELLRLSVSNNTSILAHNVSVEITIPREPGISADNTKEQVPDLPHSRRQPSYVQQIANLREAASPTHYDLRGCGKGGLYRYGWSVGDLQGKTIRNSDTYLFLRVEKEITVHVEIFCDEFPEPQKIEFSIIPAPQALSVSSGEIEADDRSFDELMQACIMDGYVARYGERLLRDYEHSTSEARP